MNSTDLNLLLALDALLDTGSVAAAAQRMHLSAPAMSHALARIRSAFGDPILVRAGRALTPTPRALELREPVQRLVAEARALMQPGSGQSLAAVEREFTVRAPEGMGVIYGATLLAALQAQMPQARLRFVPESEGDAMALREGRIDLDVGPLRDRGPEIRSSLLFEQRLVGVARAGHPILAGRVTVKRFADAIHAVMAQRPGTRDPVDTLLAEQGHRRRIELTVPSAYGALIGAARSDMVSCVPESLAATVGRSLGLVTFKLPLELPGEQILQAWHPRSDLEPAHRCLREAVASVAAQAAHGPLARQRGRVDAALAKSHRRLAG